MVGDVHRTLLYGGIFAYPQDNSTSSQENRKTRACRKTVSYKGAFNRTGQCLDQSS